MATSPVLRIQDFMSARARKGLLPQLRRAIGSNSDMRLLDVGGGTGAAADLFARGLREVIVLEPEPRKIEFGKGRRSHLRFIEGQAESIPFPEGYFDRAVALVSLHHVRDQAKALQEIHRVLASSGRVVVHEFDPQSPRGKVSRFLENDVMGHGCTFVTPDDLREKIERAGFRSAEVEPAPMGYLLTASK